MTEMNEKQAERFERIKRLALDAGAPSALPVPQSLRKIVRECIDGAALAQQPQGEAQPSTADWLSGKSVIPQFTPSAATGAQGLTAASISMSRHSRAMLLNVLWHHQGGSSPVGQPIRVLLGIGQHNRLNDEQLAEAKWIDGLLAAPSASAQQAEPRRSINSDGMLVGPDVGTGSREPVDLDGRICEHCGEGNAVLTFENGRFASNCDDCAADCDHFLVERLNHLIAAPAPTQGAQGELMEQPIEIRDAYARGWNDAVDKFVLNDTGKSRLQLFVEARQQQGVGNGGTGQPCAGIAGELPEPTVGKLTAHIRALQAAPAPKDEL